MQSASTRRFTPVPLAAVLVAAVLLGGIVALNATENLPGQGGSASLTEPVTAVLPPNAGEGLIGPRHIEALLGPGATLDSPLPMIKGAPSHGQGEGFVGPGSVLSPAVEGFIPFGPGEGFVGPGATVMDSLRPMIRGIPSRGQGEGLVGPGATTATEVASSTDSAPYNGGLTE